MPTRPLLPALLAALALTATVPAVAAAATQTESAGQTAATLTATQGRDDHGVASEQLTITRAGVAAYTGTLATKACDPEDCSPSFDEHGAPAGLEVTDLDGDGEPEVLVGQFTGGAHCCSLLQLLRFDPASGTYVLQERNFGDVGFRVGDPGDGRPALLTADDRFAYRFSSYAASDFPVQVLRYGAGRFRDVTTLFLDRVRAEVPGLRRAYRSRANLEPRGAAAAWAADEYRLGRRTATLRTLRRDARAGRLRGAPGSPAAFVRDLDGFLRRTGYLPGR